MVKVVILPELVRQIQKIFKKDAEKIYDLMEELEVYPNKGKALGNVDNIVIKELKYKSFRFYFITDGQILKFVNSQALKDLLIKFVRMSDKDNQQKMINGVKYILNILGFDEFK